MSRIARRGINRRSRNDCLQTRLRTGLRGHRIKASRPHYKSGRSDIWLKVKNPDAPAVSASKKKTGATGASDDAALSRAQFDVRSWSLADVRCACNRSPTTRMTRSGLSAA
jgi:hypothetical protein